MSGLDGGGVTGCVVTASCDVQPASTGRIVRDVPERDEIGLRFFTGCFGGVGVDDAGEDATELFDTAEWCIRGNVECDDSGHEVSAARASSAAPGSRSDAV